MKNWIAKLGWGGAAQARQRVRVSEKNGVRTLHLGSDTAQSSMRINAPCDLELAYTRSMMAFLLFSPNPKHVLMVGLGGGSLAKFIYHRMPATRCTVVEISPDVVVAARDYFFTPPQDQRFRLEIADAIEYVPQHPGKADVVMVDGFDENCQVEALAGVAFYRSCHAALSGTGMLVVNLWGSDRHFDVYRRRIEAIFPAGTLSLPAKKGRNVVVFAFKRSPGYPTWQELRARAARLQEVFGLEFPDFVEALREMNRCSMQGLSI
ncbi:MAG: polyamine aminopropyltransferase [Burkholderiales bacterium]